METAILNPDPSSRFILSTFRPSLYWTELNPLYILALQCETGLERNLKPLRALLLLTLDIAELIVFYYFEAHTFVQCFHMLSVYDISPPSAFLL